MEPDKRHIICIIPWIWNGLKNYITCPFPASVLLICDFSKHNFAERKKTKKDDDL